MEGRFATISGEARQLLRKAGFSSTIEALRLSPSALAKELGIQVSEAVKVIAELRGSAANTSRAAPVIRNALEMRESNQNDSVRAVTTLCKPLDKVLNGGLPLKQLTEICGAPGAGKTQLCMQVAVCATIPKEIGGVEGGTVYLDTEGSFSPQRAFDMAEALSSHLDQQHKIMVAQRAESPGSIELKKPPTRDDILRNIQICRAFDYGEQLAFIQNLPKFLRAHPGVRVVVVDSVAHHFRHDFPDMSQRSKILSRQAHALNAVAHDFDVAVVVTNHMTTRSDHELVPALGEHWYHGVTNRIILTKTDELVEWSHPKKKFAPVQVPLRRADIVKAASFANDSAEFVVVNIGIRSHRGRQQPPTSETSTAEVTLKRLRMIETSGTGSSASI